MTEGKELRKLGEFGLIDRIARQLSAGKGVVLGIGDDAAAFTPSPGLLSLVTTDMLIEGVHFDLSFCDPLSLGKKAVSVNLSDIAAMGGKPRYFLLSLAIPPTMTLDFLDNCIKGMLQRAEQFGVQLIGGDTCSSPGPLVLTLTVLGEQSPDSLVRRSGARPGDQVCVTGTIGDSALGLRLLQQGKRLDNALLRHLDPVPRVREGQALAEAAIPSAMIDLSDGLLADLGHILDLSSVGAQIFSEALPLSDIFREHFPTVTEEALSLALAGGEDYELLFTVPPEEIPKVFPLLDKLGTRASIVGIITAERKLAVIGPDGREIFLHRKGFNHFTNENKT
ncbi:MAG: thiamine-phosphate kinase [Geobacteraceae bacterium]|nr:thiamine-phosphate kinase [Geobacteraceae bacterium]